MANQEQFQTKKVEINLVYPQDLESHFSNHFIIQHRPDHFVLSFFQVWTPPIIADTDEERKQIAETITSVDAKCITRIVMTPEEMEAFVAVVQDNFAKYKQKREAPDG